MSTETNAAQPPETELQRQEAERRTAYQDAALELGTAISLGLLPILGQAIDIYDTLESIWRLNARDKPNDKEDAKFDLILAIIGWIPGPGDGVKKSLRLVNKNPQRFAPIMFDLLREVLEKCNIKASPEALLDEIFNAGKLRAQLGEIRNSIEGSSFFEELSADNQRRARYTLGQIERELPAWVGIVQKRLTKWKAVQPNSSARRSHREKKTLEKPGAKGEVAKDGKGHPVQGQTNSEIHGQLATEPLPMVNKLYGISGEHIADYYCYTHYGWGTGWVGHDMGNSGEWKNKPGKNSPGKLSNKTNLYHLTTEANDKGIDAVWRVPSGNAHNRGKPYAIVEAKADANIVTPNFYKNGNPKGKKPSITGKLGVTGVPKLEELLVTDPPGLDDAPVADKKQEKVSKVGKQKKGKVAAPKTASAPVKEKPPSKPPKIMVQMSYEWIAINLQKEVGPLKRDVEKNYSRHLIHAPRYLPSAEQHAQAYEQGTAASASTHTDHDVRKENRHNENDVKRAVNTKKANLRKKYGNLDSLKAEK